MTEQDKPTLVPSVLNDLMDVDGTASLVGDSIRWDGTAWAPTAYPSVNGPLLRTWTDVDATAPAEGATGGFWNGTEPTPGGIPTEWIGAPPGTPDWGYWELDEYAGWTYFITEPGVYKAEVYCVLTFDGALDHNARMRVSVVPGIHTYNTMRQTVVRSTPDNALVATFYIPELIAHPDTDNSYWSGYEPPIKNFITPGALLWWETPGAAQVPNAVSWELSLFQYVPGATTPGWR